MKTKVSYKKYGTFPDMETVKDIVLYGAQNGKNKKQYMFTNMSGEIETKTFSQVFYDTVGLGQYLYKLGLRGKKVAILSENSYYWIAAFYSVATGKMMAVPLDPRLTADELTDIMIRSQCDAIYYTDDFQNVIDIMKNTDGVAISEYIRLDDFDNLVAQGHAELKNGASDYLKDDVSGDDVGFIVYTSGTTGKSKGVMLTHKNVASDGISTCRAMTGGQAIAFLPFHHTLSWASALLASPLLTEWGYICKSLRHLPRDIATYKPQNFTAVPMAVETIYKKIWETAKKQGKEKKLEQGIKISNFLLKLGIDVRRRLFKDVVNSLGGELEVIICGGAYLDEKYERGLYELGIQVINGYGATECSPTVTCNHLDNFKFGSAGRPLDCNEVKINAPDSDGVGEVYVRGTNVMAGYYNDPEATDESFDNGWYRTGDFGYFDRDGFLFFRGRKKNLIVLSNGKNVSPEELEDKFAAFDVVKEVLVYDEDGAITGEFFIDETVADGEVKVKAFVKELNRKLPAFKRIAKVKFRKTEFPKTTTLKIKRS